MTDGTEKTGGKRHERSETTRRERIVWKIAVLVTCSTCGVSVCLGLRIFEEDNACRGTYIPNQPINFGLSE
ncbi:hypothetical protein Naga_100008g87 [Nannochloropsis gaditana]|uniref:Uncharacterized protein n=1 Tax=Nannochloropsis gaditana TaxID=72520 RepID=W7U595_9STRA|nr:hypothetical protein Naga_100008g87 [Nannochloropsis gaditana]